LDSEVTTIGLLYGTERLIGMVMDAARPDIADEQFYWSNRMGRMYLLALQDVLGRNGTNAILNEAGLRSRIGNYPADNLDLGWRFAEMSGISQALDDVYGRQGGRGIAIRAGRAWFHHAIRDFGAFLGVSNLALRLLPIGTKLRMGLNAIADTFNKTGDQIVRLEEEGNRFSYHIDRCPECWGRSSDEPICHSDLGLLQETLHHVTGGKAIRVAEILCVSNGDASCTYVVEKRPLG
jgi:predicted hydrocarbon binding protein